MGLPLICASPSDKNNFAMNIEEKPGRISILAGMQRFSLHKIPVFTGNHLWRGVNPPPIHRSVAVLVKQEAPHYSVGGVRSIRWIRWRWVSMSQVYDSLLVQVPVCRWHWWTTVWNWILRAMIVSQPYFTFPSFYTRVRPDDSVSKVLLLQHFGPSW